MAAVTAKLQLRRDTRSRWNFFNPLLQAGEIGVELPTLPGEFPMFKLGDGTNHWNDLPYGGLRGVGVASITQVGLSAPESLDTYKITYTDGAEGLFQVQNGLNGNSIISITRTTGDGSAGSLDTYEIEYTKAAKTTFTVQNGANGRGITSIVRTVGTGANGTSDTYTITYTDSTTTNFDVYNGKDGRAIINFQKTSGNGNPGTTDIYTFTYSDGTANDIVVYNGQNGVSVTGLDKVSGTSQPGETDIYRLNYSNGTFTQFSIYNGKDGRAITSFVKIAGDSSPGSFDTYRFNYSDNTHNEIQVYNGDDGIGIASFTKISGNNAPGTFNVYRLTYTNEQHSDISIYNGADGRGITGVTKVAGDNSPGTLDTYQIQFTDSTFFEFSVRNGYSGRGIVNITRTNGNGTNGTFDTYTITYTDNTTTTFDVYNGKDGKSVSLKDGNTVLVPEIASLDINGDGVVKTIDGDSVKLVINHPLDIAGNAGSATKLHTARKINGVDFDGTIDIIINAEDATPRIAVSEKGAAFGVAPLDENVKIPSIYLPAYVDDVLEFATPANFPATGETGKIYVALDTNKTYRWGGSSYAEISASPGSTDAVPEGANNLYFTYQRVRDTVLTGLSLVTGGVIAAADSVLTALGKLQKQITDHSDAVNPHPQYTNQNAFSVVTGNTGTSNSDTTTDTLAITGSNGISTAATDTPDGVVISPSYGSPVSLGAANSAGSANTFARSDHVHLDPVIAHVAASDPHSQYILKTQKGAANGVAPLNATSIIELIYLPEEAKSGTYILDTNQDFPTPTVPDRNLFVARDTGKIYRHNGSTFVEINVVPGTTDALTEGTNNLYFTAARVRATVLTGLSTATNAVITAADSVLSAFGKLQKQISDNLTTLTNHTGNTNNPHSTTAAQVGADPSGTAASAVAAHASDANAHTAVFYTKTQSDAKFNLATTKSGTSVAATTTSIDIVGNYVAATANANAVTLTFNNPLGGSIFYATDYGTLTDGTDAGTVSAAQATANTNTIIAAIAAASSAVGKKPGGIVLLPAGTFHISSTITINTSSVVLMGSGRLGNTDIGSQTGKGTTLFWNNTASGATVAMVEVVSVSGPTNPAVKGSGVCNMTLQGAGNVGIGLRVKSIHWGIFRELYIINPTAKGVSTECFITGTELGEAADTTKCTFENIGVRLLESSATAVGFFLDGATNANTSNCTFRNLAASVQGAQLALDCRNTDSNRFYDLTWNQSNGGTVQPTVLRGAAVTGTECRGNVFYSLASGGSSTGVRGVLVEGTNTAGVTFPAKNNVFYGYSIENGEPLPLVGTAADIVCQTAGGGLSPRATLTNSTATTETIVAKFQLPENALYAGSMHGIRVLGQVSSTATLIYRIRIGLLGTTADAVAATFTTTAAGAANAHTSADVLVTCLTAGTAGTATAGGSVQLVSVAYSPATAAFAAATVNTTARLFISVSVQQSVAQTYTARAASINRIV